NLDDESGKVGQVINWALDLQDYHRLTAIFLHQHNRATQMWGSVFQEALSDTTIHLTARRDDDALRGNDVTQPRLGFWKDRDFHGRDAEPRLLDPGGPKSPLGETFLTDAQLAELLQVSRRTLQRWRGEGGGPRFRRHGANIRYALSDALEWSEAKSATSTS